MNFFSQIQQILKEKHITQTKLAKILNVSQASIWEWTHTKTPPLDRFLELCEALQSTPNELLGVENINQYNNH